MDVNDFPIGAAVRTPSGRTGVVLKHRGYESKKDDYIRVVVVYDGSNGKDIVPLQPSLLTKIVTQ